MDALVQIFVLALLGVVMISMIRTVIRLLRPLNSRLKQKEKEDRRRQERIASVQQINEYLYQVEHDAATQEQVTPEQVNVYLSQLEKHLDEIKPQDEFSEPKINWDDICQFYLTATPEGTALIREFVKKHGGFPRSLGMYSSDVLKRLQEGGGIEALRLGLAAVSIEDGQGNDFREISIALSALREGAQRTGIDYRPHFAAVARVSSDEKLFPVDSSMKKYMANFLGSAR